MQYVVIIEETPDGGYSAYVPDLPVCFTVGDTLDDVQTNIRDAIASYLDEAQETGMPIPAPRIRTALVDV